MQRLDLIERPLAAGSNSRTTPSSRHQIRRQAIDRRFLRRVVSNVTKTWSTAAGTGLTITTSADWSQFESTFRCSS